ncbi:MAG: Calx-beta domain-containing protein [Thermoanaerobaculia bacterium]
MIPERALSSRRRFHRPFIAVAFAVLTPVVASGQLTTLGNQVLEQGRGDFAGVLEADDRFGGSLAVGDFDGDGFDDLVVGSDGESLEGFPEAGSVQIFYGSERGLTGSRDLVISQSTSGVPSASEAGDRFGYALAALDVDCDGFDDLAIGSPFEDIGTTFAVHDAGMVTIVFGSASGLSGTGAEGFDGNDWPQDDGPEANDHLGFSLVGISNGAVSPSQPVRKFYAGAPGESVTSPSAVEQGAIFGLVSFCNDTGLRAADRLSQASGGVSGGAELFDDFGATLGKGDWNGDGVDDMSVGAIFEDLAEQDAGLVHVFYGSAAGSWSGADEESWSQESTGILDQPDFAEQFGESLASGDFDGDGFDDIVVGVAENVDDLQAAGAAAVIYGTASGLSEVGDQLWSQDGDIVGGAELGDHFGASVAVGDFDGDGVSDLAAGVPDEALGAFAEAGAVNVIYGVRFFGLDTPGNQFFSQDTTGLSDTAAEAEDHFGSALVAGDFNGDGRSDLAIGVPNEDAGSSADSGLVQILYGSKNGVLSDFRFTSSNVLVVTERTIVLTVAVERIGATNLAASVAHHLTTSSATSGVDFQYTPGTLSWAAGERGTKTIIVRILGDDVDEPAEFIHLALETPSLGAGIVAPASRTIQIDDDDEADLSLFSDGFDTGNTSRWSAVVP